MHGSRWLCLPAVLIWISAPLALSAQAQEPLRRAPDFSPTRAGPLFEGRSSPADPPPGPVSDLRRRVPVGGPIPFPQFAQAARTIFAGTVASIVHRPATGTHSVATVSITFHVENAIRGATPGEDLTIDQWLGVWSSGQTYRVGERVLLFLYAPSKLGLTSCVAGPLGRFSVDPQGRVLLSALHLSAFRADPVLGGKSRVRFSDFAMAVRRASEEEEAP